MAIHGGWLATTLAVAAMLAGCGAGRGGRADGAAPAAETASAEAPRLLSNLGGHRHPITTSSALAQRYFDQGLALAYGFNHEAAVASFEEALRLDPGCAMCSWGIAFSLGPNINAPMGPEAGAASHAAAQRARALLDDETEAERAYVEAVARRYAEDPAAPRAPLDRAFADAMLALARRFPDDVDAATLAAEAVMDTMPWDYWTADAQPREGTAEALALLESVLARVPDHVGANHYLIHVTEKFHPERGVAAAERLDALGVEAGHLVHMPSHIYWRVGRYEDALSINQRAAAADEEFFSWCRPGAFYRAAYYPHNLHFLWAAAAAEGRAELALTTARKLAAETEPHLAEFDFLEEFLSIPVLTLVRFGRFDAVLGEPPPPAERSYQRGIHHYARGVAFARTGRAAEAEAELAALRATAGSPPARALVLAGGTAPAATLLEIGVAHLEGELAAARGETGAALAALERAVVAQDALVYMEPPPWYFPVRQALGAVLLAAGRAGEAEAVYRVDLEQYPANGWSLHGLAASLRAQGRAAEAAAADQGFRRAFARADVTLPASRF
jgi:tetratricopeptide (TPR) repeat protein